MLGILGLGNYSTLHYINRVNEEYNKLNGGYSTCPFKMLNVNFDEINRYLPDQFDKLASIVKEKIIELDELGITRILVPNITLHEIIDKIDFSDQIKKKIAHPLNLLKEVIEKSNTSEVIILGSLYTMEAKYISNALKEKTVPLKQKELVDIDKMRTSIYSQGVIERDIHWIKSFMDSYPNATFVIACTELSILLSKVKPENEIIDLAELQIKQATS